MRNDGPSIHLISFFVIFQFLVAFARVYVFLFFDPKSTKLNGQ
jgi:hypothetical protein